ncbi:MAG: hypothetical protein J6I86_07450 [Bacteroidaceae bacterium]|nr:hypothetical protein [Bacteroidaceae bacterium]
MKKTYITPEALTVVLGTCKMMAASAPTPTVDTETPVDPNDFDVKESKNVWDEEW